MLMQLGMGSQISAGPAADPSGVTATAPTANVELDWTNGDADAYTEIGFHINNMTEPQSVYDEVAPGVATYDTGTTDECPYWWVRHRKNGIYGAWVQASDSFTRASC